MEDLQELAHDVVVGMQVPVLAHDVVVGMLVPAHVVVQDTT
jgi:hypothetical protein